MLTKVLLAQACGAGGFPLSMERLELKRQWPCTIFSELASSVNFPPACTVSLSWTHPLVLAHLVSVS